MRIWSSAGKAVYNSVLASLQTGTRLDGVVAFRRRAIRIILVFFLIMLVISALTTKLFHPELTFNDAKIVALFLLTLGVILLLKRMRRFLILWTSLILLFYLNITFTGIRDGTGILASAVLFAVFMPVLGVYFIGSLGAAGGWLGGLISFSVLLAYSLRFPPHDLYLGGYSQPIDVYVMAVGSLTLSLIIALTLHDALLRALLVSQRNLDRARRSDSERIRFFGTVSHEVRNSLNGLYGLTTSLLQEDLTPDVREKVMLIQASGNSLIRTLNDSLDVSRLEYGSVEIVVKPTELRKIIHSTVAFWQPSAESKGLKLSADLPGQLPDFVLVDEARIRQILDNLIANAIKFTPEGDIRLHVETAQISSSRTELHFRIADTGIGIRPDLVERIFDPFRQEHDAVRGQFGGTGLGLYICRLQTDQMGGSIRVESTGRSGSVFHVVIPTEVSSTDLDNPHSEAGTPRNGLKVLAVDDHEGSLNYIRTLLASWDINFDTASTGQACLEKLQTENFGLLLLDSNMPEMSGLEILKAIRQTGTSADELQVIVISADGSEQTRSDFQSLGISGFLVKPVTPEMLWSAILSVSEK